jgi:hypothetical protein
MSPSKEAEEKEEGEEMKRKNVNSDDVFDPFWSKKKHFYWITERGKNKEDEGESMKPGRKGEWEKNEGVSRKGRGRKRLLGVAAVGDFAVDGNGVCREKVRVRLTGKKERKRWTGRGKKTKRTVPEAIPLKVNLLIPLLQRLKNRLHRAEAIRVFSAAGVGFVEGKDGVV